MNKNARPAAIPDAPSLSSETPPPDGRPFEASPPDARPAGRKALLVLGLVVLAFVAWLGMRVKSAMGTRDTVEKDQKTKAEESARMASAPPVVEVVRGKVTSWEPQVAFEGTLSPMQEADLAFKVTGRLQTVRVKVGDKVRAGQVLGTLASLEASAQLAAVEAQAAAADAQVGLASDAERRTNVVVASGAQSEAAGFQAREQRRLVEAQRNAAHAQVTLARTTLTNHVLTAPFAGTVTKVPSAAGSVISLGVPLFHLADLSTLKLVGSVGQQDVALVKVGGPVDIRAPGSTGAVVRGKIVAVIPALDAATKRVPVEATLVNDGSETILAGAVVRAVARGSHPVSVLAYPPTVVRPGSQDEVLVAENGKLRLRNIDFAIAADGTVLVRGGLSPQDQVVVKPWAEAKEGLVVTVTQATAR